MDTNETATVEATLPASNDDAAATTECQSDSNFERWAEAELRRAGAFDDDTLYGSMLGEAAMEHVRLFSKQGHSGNSAHLMCAILSNLLAWKPLSALTDDPEEWTEVSDGCWQSKREPASFSKDGGKTYYNLDKKGQNRPELAKPTKPRAEATT